MSANHHVTDKKPDTAVKAGVTIDPAEIERFSKLAETWWDPNGPMAPLHKINPVRVEWIAQKIAEHCRVPGLGSGVWENTSQTPNPKPQTLPASLRLLDIGCGAGLVSESLVKLGAAVTGIDASVKNIEAARVHAAQSGLDIDYRCTTAEDLLSSVIRHPSSGHDVVLALEIIEHVADIPAFVEATAKLVKPGGLLIYSTINRTAKAYALAIVGAEYVLRWLPRGTHDWKKFVKPSELAAHLRHQNIAVKEMCGLVLNPLTWKWEMNPRDIDVNYMLVASNS